MTYTYADENDLPASSSRCCTPGLQRCSSYLALGLTGLFGLCAVLLPIAWFIVVPFYIDTDALHHKYDFEPMKLSAFLGWGYALITLIAMLTPVIAFGVIQSRKVEGRLALFGVGFVYVLMLVIGNALSTSRTDSRIAYKDSFAIKFNEYYCDSRTLRMCLDKKSDLHQLVLLTRGNITAASTTTSNATVAGVLDSETPTTAALAIWTRCKAVILGAMARETARDNEAEEAAEMEIETGKIYRFVDACGTSHAADAWCGSFLTRKTPFTDAEHQTLPAPFAANVVMFESYTQEWSRRMDYSNVLLGAAVGCMALAAGSFALHGCSSNNAQGARR